MNLPKNAFVNTILKQFFALGLIVFLLASSAAPTFSQRRIAGGAKKSGKTTKKKPAKTEQKKNDDLKAAQNDEMKGERVDVQVAGQFTTQQLMDLQARLGDNTVKRPEGAEEEEGGRDDRILPDGPGAQPFNRYPYPEKGEEENVFLNLTAFAPQTVGTQFDGATGPAETAAFPPDTTGAVGPTQYFVFLNGRLRTFNKTTGVADGVINASSDTFFASTKTPPLAGEVVISTDPNIRFDRLSNRWFLNMIDAPLNSTTGATTRVNRIMIAVSDAASNGTISGTTVWTLYQFTGDATLFTDYQSMGMDASAMYVGGNMFTLAGSFSRTDGWVVRKAEMLTGSPLVVTHFTGFVATATGAGPFSPRGVDNFDPAATTEGYFIGVDNATFNTLMLRRVSNPGSATPTVGANVSIATPLTTRFPVKVPHLGNTGGTNGRLDSLDDRLYLAVIRNGRLWTAHNIGVNNTGVAGATNNRNAARWYELQNVISPGTPSVLQSGTLFDNNATNDANQRNYSIPSIMVSGQGHAALGCTIAGTNERVNAFTTGRLTGDTLGTLRDGPGGTAFPGYTASATAYNPPSDPGGTGGRRWGDYSNVSLDPKDDMSMWTIQEYCNGTNTYSVRVARLLAPPPPPAGTNTSTPASVGQGAPSLTLTINGTSPAGQGFYDPGTNPPAPHTTFNHISASGAGITVNSTTYVNPTQIKINVSTIGSTAGAKTITITNPDGQTTTVQVTVLPTTAAGAEITGKVSKANGTPLRGAALTLSNSSGGTFNTTTHGDGTYLFEDIPVGSTYVMTAAKAGYTFNPPTRTFNLEENLNGADFTAAADAAHSRTMTNDFDGDGISDYAVYRPSQGVWYILESTTNSMRAEIFGIASDVPVAADYDGDGKTDVALWRESEGNWYIKQSSDGAVVTRKYGQAGDIPVYGYYDDDAKIDLAVFRAGTWWINKSTDNSNQTVNWGISTDRPVPQDYDGDGKTDIGVFRPSSGTWYVIKSANGAYHIQQFGVNNDLPALGDFDGDGRADLSVYRAADSTWYTLETASAQFKALPYGVSGDKVVAGDYDGDGKSDNTVFRPSDSTWYVNSTLNQIIQSNPWGKSGDIPVIPPSMR
jgi:Carboxypeptidase regulatory-like domain/FG-GAP-like repeat